MEPDLIESRHGDEPPRWGGLRRRPGRGWWAAGVALALAGGLAAVAVHRSPDPHGPAVDAAPVVTPAPPEPAPSPSVVPDPATTSPPSPPRLPAAGRVIGGTLPDGSLVYVIGETRTQARLVEAVSPIRDHGLGVQLGWCPAGNVLVDPASGLTYDRYGRRVAGPAARDLAVRTLRLVGTLLTVGGPHHQPAGEPGGRCPATRLPDGSTQQALTYAQYLLPSSPVDLRQGRGVRVGPVVGALAFSRSGRPRFCATLSGRSDCGPTGHRVLGVSAALAGGRYPWLIVRAGWGRVGADGAIRDLAVAGLPYPDLRPAPARTLYLTRLRLSGRSVIGPPMRFLTGDAAELASAAEGGDVPVENDYYLAEADARPHRYLLRDDATFTVVDLAHDDFARPVSFRAWARAAGGHVRVWELRLDGAGRVRWVHERYTP